MPLPTLGRKGKLKDPNGDPVRQAALDEIVPIDYIIDWFKDRANNTGIHNRVMILKSETASGKSTYFLGELYRRLVRNAGTVAPGIICTQPRILTAIRNVFEILKYNSDILRMGKNIGYLTGNNKVRPTQHGLLSVTVGTLAAQLKSMSDNEIMDTYRYILIDETHERDLYIDMTLYMLKNFLLRCAGNQRCPFVVCMSATFDPEPFLKYFTCTYDNFIWVGGASYPIEAKWDWNGDRTVNDYARAAATVVDKICRSAPNEDSARADILIFMPGKMEFKATAKWLDKVNYELVNDKIAPFSLLQIDSDAQKNQNIDYMRLDIPVSQHKIKLVTPTPKKKKVPLTDIFKGSSDDRSNNSSSNNNTSNNNTTNTNIIPTRRVIISTVIAETGLTLENLEYVIDAGFSKEIEFNPNYGIRGLITKPAPQSRIRQRMGRVGRNFPGIFYPLYPKYIHDRLPVQQLPQILLEDVSIIMLDIIKEQFKTKLSYVGSNEITNELTNSNTNATSLITPVINPKSRATIEFLCNDIDMIDVPSSDALTFALTKLYTLGLMSMTAPDYTNDMQMLNADGSINMKFKEHISADTTESITTDTNVSIITRCGLTKLGVIASEFNIIPIECLRMIFAGWFWQCSIIDLITIAAYLMLPTKDIIRGRHEDEQFVKIVINWEEVYKLGFTGKQAMIGTNRPTNYYKLRLLICDEFIDGIFLCNAVKSLVGDLSGRNVISGLNKWCIDNNINYSGLMRFIEIRDDIIDQALSNNLDIFANEQYSLARCTQDTLMTVITKIKLCIYEGFRNNILVRGEKSNVYKTHTGTEVITPKLLQDTLTTRNKADLSGYKLDILPTVMLYNNIGLKQLRNDPTGAYGVIPERVSAMAGFVNIDDNFL